MDSEQVRARIYSRIDEIPTLPAVVPKLLRLVGDEQTGAAEVARAVSNDAALASKLLKVANSAYYGFAQRIATLEQAVPLLGFRMVRSLALSVGVIHALPSRHSSELLPRDGVWIHSLAVATAMEELARGGPGDADRDHLFALGLLHDVGKMVLLEFFPEPFEQAIRQALDSPETPVHEAERAVIGLDHGEVGAMLLERWRLPAVIVETIAVHHQETIPAGVDRVSLAALRTADAVAHQLGLGEGDRPDSFPLRSDDLEALGIRETDLEEVRLHVDAARPGILDFFRNLS